VSVHFEARESEEGSIGARHSQDSRVVVVVKRPADKVSRVRLYDKYCIPTIVRVKVMGTIKFCHSVSLSDKEENIHRYVLDM
jgi:hypothetical protein